MQETGKKESESMVEVLKRKEVTLLVIINSAYQLHHSVCVKSRYLTKHTHHMLLRATTEMRG